MVWYWTSFLQKPKKDLTMYSEWDPSYVQCSYYDSEHTWWPVSEQ